MARKGRTKTILVVEDEADVLTLVTRTLELEGYRVLQATDGRAALETLGDNQVDLVLLDLLLPVLDGWAVLREIKGNPELKTIPVAVFTASASLHKSEEALMLGASAYLMKPLNLDDLLKTVRHVLRVGR